MILYDKFFRDFVTRRAGDLTKLENVSKLEELPPTVVLHLMDNLQVPETEISPVPRVDNLFYRLPPERKYLLPMIDKNHKANEAIIKDEFTNIRLILVGVIRDLKEFKTKMRGKCRLVDHPTGLIPKREIGSVITYNPLFMARIRGIRKRMQLVEFLLANIMNNIAMLPDRTHFVHIPLTTIQYPKSDFIKSFKEHDKQTLKFPNSTHYLMMAHYLSFVKVDSESSILNKLPEELWDKVIFCFSVGDKIIFHNLKTIKEMNGDGDTIMLRLIGHLNLLASSGLEHDLVENIKTVDNTIIEVRPGEKNAPGFTEAPTPAERKEFIEQDVKSMEETMDKTIKEANLTPAQERRAKEKSRAYKSLTVGGVTLEELMTETEQTLSDSEVENLKDELVDKSMTKSKIAFDQDYMQKSFNKDMATTLMSFNQVGMFVTDIKEEPQIDEMNNLMKYTISFEDVHQKSHTIRFTIPKVQSDSTCVTNGLKRKMTKQRVNVPIVKIGETRVSLNSNYNKILVERNTNVSKSFVPYFDKMLAKADSKVKRTLGSAKLDELVLPYEYTALGRKYLDLKLANLELTFNHPKRFDKVLDRDKKMVESMEKKHGVYIGQDKKAKVYLFLDLKGNVNKVGFENQDEVNHSTLIDEASDYLDQHPTPLNEWIDVVVLSKKVPLAFMLCYRFGLTNTLNYLGADYKVYDINERVTTKQSDIIIRFLDKKIVLPRSPLAVSLIMAGMNYFNFKQIAMGDMDDKNVYYDLMSDKGMSTNYLKGIDDFFDLFMDPITKDVLFQMKEPTNFRDLLIRAAALLTTEDHDPPSAESNFRFRSYERIPAQLYNSMSRAYATYKNDAIGSTGKFSIKEHEVKQKISLDPLMENYYVVNPIDDIKARTRFSHVGAGGRTSETFMIVDRQFDPSSLGVVSEATIDSGAVAVVAQLSMNPNMQNTRGLTKSKKPDEVEPTEMLSVTGCLLPCVTNDDGKRANFSNIQISHYVPVKEAELSRVRTGYEKMIPHLTNPPFAYTAKDNGVILDINESVGMFKVQYNNGDVEVVDFGEDYTNNSANGFYVTQTVILNGISKGSKFKKGDVLCYNTGFFKKDEDGTGVDWMCGVNANLALVDTDYTLEDSSVISQTLANKLEFKPSFVRDIAITKDTTVHAYAPVGAEISSTGALITFDEADIPEGMKNDQDQEYLDILNKLNRATPRAKHTGKIVRIEAFHRCGLSDMSESLRAIVKKAEKVKSSKSGYAKDSVNSDLYPKAGKLTVTDKMGLINLDDDVVLLRFYIQHDTGMTAGSKILFDSSLKSVVAKVVDEDMGVEDGSIPVHAMMSARAVAARIVQSPFFVGVASRIMENVEKQAIDMYFE